MKIVHKQVVAYPNTPFDSLVYHLCKRFDNLDDENHLCCHQTKFNCPECLNLSKGGAMKKKTTKTKKTAKKAKK